MEGRDPKLGLAVLLLREMELYYFDVISHLDHPERNYLSVYKIREPKGVLKFRVKTDNGCRKVPIHIELEQLLRRRMEFVRSKWGEDISQLPICCLGNRFDQPCKDYQLANLADELFGKIKLGAADLLPFQVEQYLKQLRGKGEERKDAKEALTLYVLRRNFWTWMESSTQTTDFEKRYVMGHDMKVDGKSRRRDYNDEAILWEIGQKMDRAVLSEALHRQSVTYIVTAEAPVRFENRGICICRVPEELLLTGGTLYIEVETEEAGDALRMEILSGKRAIGKPERVEVEGWPASRREITGINCEYENWEAHQKPTAPAARKKGCWLDCGD